MKISKFTGLIAAALLMTGLASCDSKQTLAKEINGSWSASPDRIADTEAMSTCIVRIVDFDKAPSQAGGDMILSGLVSVSSQLPVSESVQQPVSLTAGGVASIRRTWLAHDDDEIVVVLDPETFTVNVDSSAVVLTTDILTGDDAPDLALLKPSAVAMVRQQITQAAQTDFFSIHKIDDIKIHDNMMSCEINDRDITLRRQIDE